MKKLLHLFILVLFAEGLFAQDFSFNLVHDGKTRDFIVHSPCATYNCTGQKLPVVFAFHGLTETNTSMRNYTKFNEVADTAGFILVYPQGINNSWNDGSTTSTEDDLGFTNAMIDYLLANSNNCPAGFCAQIDTERIYSCGMSNGGFFSYRLACQLSNRIAAIASVTGSMDDGSFTSCNPLRPIPVFEIHGTSDPIVGYTGTAATGASAVADVLNYWIAVNGCTNTPVTTSLPDVDAGDGSTVEKIHYNNCTASTEVLHYKITGGGHTWPSMIMFIPLLLSEIQTEM